MFRLLFLTLSILFSITSFAQISYKTTCPTEAYLVKLKIKSDVTYVKQHVKDSETFVREAIAQQVLYFKSDLKYQIKKSVIDLVFADESLEPVVLESKSEKLSTAYQLETVNHKDVTFSNKYLIKLLEQKNIPTGEELVRVRYEQPVHVYVCRDKKSVEKVLAKIKLQAPADPWLAHWSTAKGNFQDVKWNQSEFKIPPFFDSEYADIPHPELAWYFWNPQHKGKTKSGRAYSAAQYTKQNKQLATAFLQTEEHIKLKSGNKFKNSFFKSDKKEILATVIFGVTEPKSKQLEIKKIFENKQVGNADAWKAVNENFLKWNSTKEIDPGSLFATGFLTNMHEFLNEESLSYTYKESESLIEFKGFLKQSGKAVRINFYFGPTDVLAGHAPQHWSAAYHGLVNDDLVFYIGHSGLGENFKWANILQNVQARTPAAELKKHNRIVGIFSCYSANYFEQDLSSFLTGESALILTGSSYTSARGPVGILKWVDESFSKSHDSTELSHLMPSDFLIFKKIGEEL
jgi:hypothetical protein